MDLAFWIYLIGNLALASCGALLLWNHYRGANMQDASKNTQILLMVSSMIRIDWTSGLVHRGPRLWGQASDFFDPLCKMEAIASVVIWVACVLRIPRPEKEKQIIPVYARWYAMLVWALVGPFLLVCNGIFWDSHVHLTVYAYICPYNMAMDTFAIVPQLLILRSQRAAETIEAPAAWLGHIVAMLSLNHAARVGFWICYFWKGSALLSFALPDFIGLLVMADFLYVYLQVIKMRAEEIVQKEAQTIRSRTWSPADLIPKQLAPLLEKTGVSDGLKRKKSGNMSVEDQSTDIGSQILASFDGISAQNPFASVPGSDETSHSLVQMADFSEVGKKRSLLSASEKQAQGIIM